MYSRTGIKNQTPNSAPLRFPQKLWKIANECQSGAVSWSPHGKSILLRYSLFREEFMSTKSDFFKTDNISSFVRQLNLYGFRKVYDHTHKQAYKANPDLHEFSNSHFQRDRQDLLEKVTRKSGILKDKNDFFSENERLGNDSCSDVKSDDEKQSIDETNPSDACVENKENIPPLSAPEPPTTSEEPLCAKIILSVIKCENGLQPLSFPPPQEVTTTVFDPSVSVKKKRGRKPGSKCGPNKSKLFRLSRLNLKPRKQFSSLKRPELFPDLIYFNDEDNSHYLRNTSRDVMLSSTLPFHESPEYKDLKETYQRLYEPRVRLRYSSLPLNLTFNCKSSAADTKSKLQQHFYI